MAEAGSRLDRLENQSWWPHLLNQERGHDPYGMFWRIYPKFHMFVHCVEELADSPADSWAYQDEDTIGEAARLAKSLHCMTLQRTLMQKYRVQPDNLRQSEKTLRMKKATESCFE